MSAHVRPVAPPNRTPGPRRPRPAAIAALPAVALMLGGWSPDAGAGVPAWTSYHRLPSANGLGVVVWSGDGAGGGRLDRFSDRLYQVRSPGDEPVRDLLYDSYFGLRTASGARWLTATAGAPSWTPGTNAFSIPREAGALEVTERVWAPMDLDLPAFVHVLELHNTSAAPITGVEVFSLHNVHVGAPTAGGPLNGAERVEVADGGLLTEVGVTTGLVWQVHPFDPPDRAGCDDVWARVGRGDDLDGPCAASRDDAVGALQWSVPSLAPGERRQIAVVQTFSSGGDLTSAPAAVAAWRGGRSAEELDVLQQAGWAAWLAAGRHPTDLRPDEEPVYQQALVFLKMGQVREPGEAYGQIPASLPVSAPVGSFQHEWNITWVRDGAYAIAALAQAGYTDEALDALAFQIQPGKSGGYRDQLGVSAYALSVCRYYGDGTEWSDEDATGPNIELDNFGLWLWAAAEALDAAGDDAFLREHEAAIFDGVAQVLEDTIDPAWDLTMADSSIWERHWNGNQKHFTYSSAWAVRGLREAARMADRAGDPRAERWRAAADQIAAGIGAHLISEDDVLVGNLEELQRGAPSLDLAAVDAFNAGVLPLDDGVFAASVEAWRSGLGVSSGNGFKRNDDGDLYDEQEWVMVDLRLAAALRRACRLEEAAELEAWITAQAQANHWIIPELMEPTSAAYAGPAPMMGFGSGLYALNLLERAPLEAACAGGPDTGRPDSGGGDGGEGGAADGADGGSADGGAADSAAAGDPADPTGDTPKTGCSCGSTSPRGGGLALVAAGLVGLAARRRRPAPPRAGAAG